MKPDLIFMDIVMPGVNGFQATRKLASTRTPSDPGDHGHLEGPGDRPRLGYAPGRGRLPREAGVDGKADREGAGRARRLSRTDRHVTGNATLNPCATSRSSCCASSSALARIARTGQGRDAAASANGSASRSGSAPRVSWSPAKKRAKCSASPSVVTRVPGAKAWIRGIANVRGQLLPVVDLRAFLGGGTTNTDRSTRVLVAHHREVPAGLLVDEVLGFRRFNEGEFSGATAADDRALRALSRRRVPPRHGELAGVQPAHAAREPANSCRRPLRGAPHR